VQAPWMGWYHVAACVYAGGGRLVWRDGGVLAAALPFSASSTAESPGLASCTARETLFASAVARRLPCLLAYLLVETGPTSLAGYLTCHLQYRSLVTPSNTTSPRRIIYPHLHLHLRREP
jgi:hypothetical protein